MCPKVVHVPEHYTGLQHIDLTGGIYSYFGIYKHVYNLNSVLLLEAQFIGFGCFQSYTFICDVPTPIVASKQNPIQCTRVAHVGISCHSPVALAIVKLSLHRCS